MVGVKLLFDQYNCIAKQYLSIEIGGSSAATSFMYIYANCSAKQLENLVLKCRPVIVV